MQISSAKQENKKKKPKNKLKLKLKWVYQTKKENKMRANEFAHDLRFWTWSKHVAFNRFYYLSFNKIRSILCKYKTHCVFCCFFYYKIYIAIVAVFVCVFICRYGLISNIREEWIQKRIENCVFLSWVQI